MDKGWTARFFETLLQRLTPESEDVMDVCELESYCEESCYDTVPYQEFEVSGRHETN